MSKVRFLGMNDFGELRKSEGLFVDKSMLIKELFECGSGVMLITRPRRFGKSFNMNMINTFLSIEVDEQGKRVPEDLCENRKLFLGGEVQYQGEIVQLKPLKISYDDRIKNKCGKHPVIFISFKPVDGMSYNAVLSGFASAIRVAFSYHMYLLNSDKLDNNQKQTFYDYINSRTAFNEEMVAQSLEFLTNLLYIHFDEKVWILIDEYDAPLNNGYVNLHRKGRVDDFESLRALVSTIMTSVLKDNTQVCKAVITGIFRLAKTAIFSKLNNVEEYSIFNKKLAEFYGFTQEEIDKLLIDADLFHRREEIKRWYNGYTFGGLEIYNPWSIMSCLNHEGDLGAYWLDTGSTSLFDPKFLDDKIQEKLLRLRNWGKIEISIPDSITFENLVSDEYFFYMLLIAGYLKPSAVNIIDNIITCQISVVNVEIMRVFISYAMKWMQRCLQTDSIDYLAMMKKILNRNTIDEFISDFSQVLLYSVSYFDVARNKAEVFYAGFVGVLLNILSTTHIVHKEIEAGDGRADVIMLPKDFTSERAALVIEYKVAKNLEDLEQIAQEGLDQIIARKYDAFIQKHDNINDILHISMAFYKKNVCVKYV